MWELIIEDVAEMFEGNDGLLNMLLDVGLMDVN
jgi:hypothetical protein